MKKCIDLSIQNAEQNSGGPFAALIVKNNKIIGIGQNSVTSNNDPTAHGEIMAIRDACKKLDNFTLAGCTIYTSCEPCPMCLSAIYWARLDKIYYGNTKEDAANIGFSDDFIYKELDLSKKDRNIKSEQCMRDDANVAFKIWDDKSDKIEY